MMSTTSMSEPGDVSIGAAVSSGEPSRSMPVSSSPLTASRSTSASAPPSLRFGPSRDASPAEASSAENAERNEFIRRISNAVGRSAPPGAIGARKSITLG
jgi:hypothetical protein